MKKASPLLLAAALFCFQAGLSAQDLETGYFLGGNPYAFRLNPAFQSERNIVTIGLGQTGMGLWSNLGFSTLLYPDSSDGHLYSFMNDRVNAGEFLRKIKKNNTFDTDARLNLVTVGFWSGDQFYTVDLNIRSLNSAEIPYDLFSFWKEGAESRNQFDFSNLGFRSQTFAEAAVGWSKHWDDALSFGFRVKALLGGMELNALAKNMKLAMSGERWEVQAQTFLYGSSPALGYKLDKNGNPDPTTVYLKDDAWSVAGFGGAVDLGVSWTPLPELTLSASLLDLGGLRWNRELQFISPESSYVWAPSESEDIASGDWEAEFNKALDALSGAFRFQDASGSGGAFAMLPVQLYLGAEYRMPFYERLSVGALYAGRMGAGYGRQAGRVTLNWNPLDFLSLSTGTTLNRFGESFGFALNLHPVGVNLLIGCDYVPFHSVRVSSLLEDADLPKYIKRNAILPRDQMKLNLYVGLNVAFGQARLDHARRFREQ